MVRPNKCLLHGRPSECRVTTFYYSLFLLLPIPFVILSAPIYREGSLPPHTRISQLTDFLRANLDVFTWNHGDMVGIAPEVISHKFNVDPSYKPVRQKRRPMTLERYTVLKEEVDNLLANKSIREAHYPTWVANPILVKMKNGKWRRCVDFTDQNKAYPKDSFPLPKINQLVDAIADHQLLNFIDAYLGYNQIPMYPSDEEHTSFIIG